MCSRRAYYQAFQADALAPVFWVNTILAPPKQSCAVGAVCLRVRGGRNGRRVASLRLTTVSAAMSITFCLLLVSGTFQPTLTSISKSG